MSEQRIILTAHQPVYLPWLGLFHKIALADTFVSFNRVQYLPKDWNNRNRIKTSAGPIWLTVPVLKKGHRDKPLDELEINNAVAWRRKHWNALSLNYAKAPYFDDYAGFFEETYGREWQMLTELNDYMLEWFLDTLGISVRFLRASDFEFQGAKSALVLDMCRQLEARTYVFGALGRDYADVEAFGAADIDVVFQDYVHPVYPQLYDTFVPYLSVVDLLFNCGPASLDVILAGQEVLA